MCAAKSTSICRRRVPTQCDCHPIGVLLTVSIAVGVVVVVRFSGSPSLHIQPLLQLVNAFIARFVVAVLCLCCSA